MLLAWLNDFPLKITGYLFWKIDPKSYHIDNQVAIKHKYNIKRRRESVKYVVYFLQSQAFKL